MYAWLSDAVANGVDIVTANKRLSRELRSAYDAEQVSRGLSCWHTPRILSWSVWLNSLLDQCAAGEALPLRLDIHGSAILWERLLKAFAEDRMLNPSSLVGQVQRNWQRLHEWCVPIDELDRYASSDDEKLFAAIATAYRRELEKNGWIDQAQLAPLVMGLLQAGRIRAGDQVLFAGFDRYTPSATRLFQILRDSGSRVSEAPDGASGQTVRTVSCTGPDAELRAAGLWARRCLQTDAVAKVAIVCRGLEQNATRTASLIREGLAPGWQHGGERHRRAVNVSYGRRLSEYPLIAVALLWLRWTCSGVSARDVSLLLRSPFAGRLETDGRCRLEVALRRLPDRDWRPAALAAALQGPEQSADASDWLQRVRKVAAFGAQRSRPEPPAEWAATIDELLQQVGWPGARPLDSIEFQLVNRWRDLLNELSRLDLVLPRINAAEAVSRLTSFAAGTLYQPEQGPGAVQLLGTLEAAGLEFDHLWVCGLDAQNWPPPANPLPLVSRELQRKLGMPHATPTDTLDYSRRVLQRLAASAGNVILSWHQTAQDLELEPSPLLAPYLRQEPGRGEDPGWYASSLAGGGVIDPAVADPVPAIRAGEKVSGGATAVQRQLEAPFSAFAYGRLGVKDLQTFQAGLSASTRGSIVHRALHHLLMDKPTSSQIAAWTDTELDERIERSVDAALVRHARSADGVLLRLLAIERRRLRGLLAKFLEEELLRQDFEVVSVEESTQFLRHGVRLDLRIDRIDRVADGSVLIIDYKTGIAKSLLGRAGEPKQAQLVVYASALDETIGGLLLINVDSRAIIYKGAGPGWDRGSLEPWEERLARWKKSVDLAIAGIAAGDVRLNMAQSAPNARPLNVLSRVEEVRRER